MAYRVLVGLVVLGVVAALVLPWWATWRVGRLRARHVPWPEIARRTWRGRRLAGNALTVAPAAVATAVVVPSPESVTRWAFAAAGLLVTAVVLNLVYIRAFAHMVRDPMSPSRAARLLVTSSAAQFAASVVAWPIVAATPDPVAPAVIGGVGLVVFAQQRGWFTIVRAVGLARLAPPTCPFSRSRASRSGSTTAWHRRSSRSRGRERSSSCDRSSGVSMRRRCGRCIVGSSATFARRRGCCSVGSSCRR